MPANTFNLFGVPEVLLRLRARPEVLARVRRPRDRPADAREGRAPRPARPLRRLSGRDRDHARPAADAVRAPRAAARGHSRGARAGRTPSTPAQDRSSTFRSTSCPSASGTRPSTSRRSGCRSRGRGMQLHWDGNNVDVGGAQQERGVRHRHDAADDRPRGDRAARGVAARPRSRRSIRYPIDPSSAARGAPIYAAYCAGCHGANGRNFQAPAGTEKRECVNVNENDDELYGPQVGKITRIERDRHRPRTGSIRSRTTSRQPSARSTPATRGASAISARPSATRTCRSTACGCARRTCTTARCRRLRDLLEPAAKRPPNVLSRQRRLRSEARSASSPTLPEQGGRQVLHLRHIEAGQRQRRPRGQGVYGTELPPDDKDALVEYLKTF